jgi:hypothetical protein
MPSFESGKGRTSKAKLKAPKSTAARKGKGGAARRSRGSNRNGGDDQSAAKRLYRILASLGMDGQEEILGAIKAMAKGATAQTEKGKHARDLGYCVDVYHKRGTIPPKKVDEFLALVLELIAERKADLSATHAAEAARGKAGAKGKSRQQRKATLPAKRAAPKGPRVEYERDDADRDDYAQSIAAAPSRVTPGMAMLASVGERKAAEASAEHESHFAKSRREKAQRKQQLVVSLGFTARSYTERLVAQQAQRAAEEAKRVRAELEEERARAAVRAAAGFAHMQDRHDEELVSVLQRSVLEQAAERERFRGYETALRESRLEAAARAAEPEWEGLLDVLGSVSVEEENAWTVAGKGKVKVKTKGAAQESRAQARAAASAPLSAGALRLAELDRAAGALRAAKRASAATAADEEQSFADDISRAQQLSRATTAAPSPREQEVRSTLRYTFRLIACSFVCSSISSLFASLLPSRRHATSRRWPCWTGPSRSRPRRRRPRAPRAARRARRTTISRRRCGPPQRSRASRPPTPISSALSRRARATRRSKKSAPWRATHSRAARVLRRCGPAALRVLPLRFRWSFSCRGRTSCSSARPAGPGAVRRMKRAAKAVSCILCTVTYYANLAHSLTRSP